jgi:hypothetical protein
VTIFKQLCVALVLVSGCGRLEFDARPDARQCDVPAGQPSIGSHLLSLSASTIARDIINDVAVDSAGNIIITGNFEGTLALGGETFTSNGARDLFVAKLSPIGDLLWAEQVGGIGDDIESSVVIGPDDSVFLLGEFQCELDYAGMMWSTSGHPGCTAALDNIWDIYVIAYGADGSLRWRREFGGTSDLIGGDLVVTPSGKVIAGTYHRGTVDFGAGPHTSPTATYEAAIVGFDETTTWSVGCGGDSFDSVESITSMPNGDIVATGQFVGSLDFGDGTILTASGNSDIFVARYTQTGTRLWARAFGGALDEVPHGVVVSSSDDIYIVGEFSGTMTIGVTTLVASGAKEGFGIRLAGDGSPVWARDTDTLIASTLHGVAIDTAGDLVAIGTVGTDARIALLGFAADGAVRWTETFGSGNTFNGLAVATIGARGLVIGGGIGAPTDFGGGTLSYAAAGDGFAAVFCAQRCEDGCAP